MKVGSGQNRLHQAERQMTSKSMRKRTCPISHVMSHDQVSDRGADRRTDLEPHGGGNAAIKAAFCSDRPKQELPTASAWLSKPGGDPGNYTSTAAAHTSQNTRSTLHKLKLIFKHYLDKQNRKYGKRELTNNHVSGRPIIHPRHLRQTSPVNEPQQKLIPFNPVAENDPTAKMLDYLIEFVKEQQGHGGRRHLLEKLGRLSPTGRRLFACHFKPQRLTDIAADPDQSAARRLMAVRLLEAGANEHCHLRIEDAMVSMGKVTYLIIKRLTQQGLLQEAVDSLRLFAGLNQIDAARLVRLTSRLRC